MINNLKMLGLIVGIESICFGFGALLVSVKLAAFLFVLGIALVPICKNFIIYDEED